MRWLLLVALCACSKTITVEVQGTGKVGESVRHGTHELGVIHSVGRPNAEGVSAIEVTVERDFLMPTNACGYVIGDAVFVRGSIDEVHGDVIPHCSDELFTLEGAIEGFFDDLAEQGEESGIDFSEPVRRAIEPHARMARIQLPEAKPEVTEPED